MICKNCGQKFKVRKGLKKTQKDCSEACLIDRFDKMAHKTRALARAFAGTLGYRSMFEVRFSALCKQNRLTFTYETKTVEYQHKPQKYTPDFSKKEIHLECKGVLDKESRKKLLAVKRCNPDLDLRLVFEKPNNKLYKGAQWKYWEWAEKKGFKWYSWQDMEKIKAEVK